MSGTKHSSSYSDPRWPVRSHHARRTCELAQMRSPILVIPREAPGHRQAREQREQLNKITTELVASWWDHKDDPFMTEALRGLALAQSLDDSHPIDRHGRCKRWRCTQRWWWPFTRRQCPTRVTLNFCRTADTVALWFHVLNRLPNLQVSLTAVRTWETGCHTNNLQTNKPKHEPATTHSTVK
jgi:hypothetical protein